MTLRELWATRKTIYVKTAYGRFVRVGKRAICITLDEDMMPEIEETSERVYVAGKPEKTRRVPPVVRD